MAAAVSAARLGADVTLLERNGYLGGLATGGLVILLLTMDDGNGNTVIGGLCREVVERLTARGAAVAPPENERFREEPELVDRWAEKGLVLGKGAASRSLLRGIRSRRTDRSRERTGRRVRRFESSFIPRPSIASLKIAA